MYYERLVPEILRQACKDLETTNEKLHAEVHTFLKPPWFSEMVEGVKWNPVEVRTRMETGQFDRKALRSPYRKNERRIS